MWKGAILLVYKYSRTPRSSCCEMRVMRKYDKIRMRISAIRRRLYLVGEWDAPVWWSWSFIPIYESKSFLRRDKCISFVKGRNPVKIRSRLTPTVKQTRISKWYQKPLTTGGRSGKGWFKNEAKPGYFLWQTVRCFGKRQEGISLFSLCLSSFFQIKADM